MFERFTDRVFGELDLGRNKELTEGLQKLTQTSERLLIGRFGSQLFESFDQRSGNRLDVTSGLQLLGGNHRFGRLLIIAKKTLRSPDPEQAGGSVLVGRRQTQCLLVTSQRSVMLKHRIVASGAVGGEPIELPPGTYRVLVPGSTRDVTGVVIEAGSTREVRL